MVREECSGRDERNGEVVIVGLPVENDDGTDQTIFLGCVNIQTGESSPRGSGRDQQPPWKMSTRGDWSWRLN